MTSSILEFGQAREKVKGIVDGLRNYADTIRKLSEGSISTMFLPILDDNTDAFISMPLFQYRYSVEELKLLGEALKYALNNINVAKNELVKQKNNLEVKISELQKKGERSSNPSFLDKFFKKSINNDEIYYSSHISLHNERIKNIDNISSNIEDILGKLNQALTNVNALILNPEQNLGIEDEVSSKVSTFSSRVQYDVEKACYELRNNYQVYISDLSEKIKSGKYSEISDNTGLLQQNQIYNIINQEYNYVINEKVFRIKNQYSQGDYIYIDSELLKIFNSFGLVKRNILDKIRSVENEAEKIELEIRHLNKTKDLYSKPFWKWLWGPKIKEIDKEIQNKTNKLFKCQEKIKVLIEKVAIVEQQCKRIDVMRERILEIKKAISYKIEYLKTFGMDQLNIRNDVVQEDPITPVKPQRSSEEKQKLNNILNMLKTLDYIRTIYEGKINEQYYQVVEANIKVDLGKLGFSKEEMDEAKENISSIVSYKDIEQLRQYAGKLVEKYLSDRQVYVEKLSVLLAYKEKYAGIFKYYPLDSSALNDEINSVIKVIQGFYSLEEEKIYVEAMRVDLKSVDVSNYRFDCVNNLNNLERGYNSFVVAYAPHNNSYTQPSNQHVSQSGLTASKDELTNVIKTVPAYAALGQRTNTGKKVTVYAKMGNSNNPKLHQPRPSKLTVRKVSVSTNSGHRR